jgi:hypothetical protein
MSYNSSIILINERTVQKECRVLVGRRFPITATNDLTPNATEGTKVSKLSHVRQHHCFDDEIVPS